MQVRPGGCLLTVLSILALLALGILEFGIMFVGGFNDNGDPAAAAGIGHALEIVGGLMILSGVLAVVGIALALSTERQPRGTFQRTIPPSMAPALPRDATASRMPVGKAVLIYGGLLLAGIVLPTGCFKIAMIQSEAQDKGRQAEEKASAERILIRLNAALAQEKILRPVPCPSTAYVPSNLYMPQSTCFLSERGGLEVGAAYRRALKRLQVKEIDGGLTPERDDGFAFNYITDDVETPGQYPNAVQFRMEYVSRSELTPRAKGTDVDPDHRTWWAKQPSSVNTFLAVEPQFY